MKIWKYMLQACHSSISHLDVWLVQLLHIPEDFLNPLLEELKDLDDVIAGDIHVALVTGLSWLNCDFGLSGPGTGIIELIIVFKES